MAVVLLAGAVGAAFSGVVLYSYYEYRLDKTEARVSGFIGGFSGTLKAATDDINVERDGAKAEIAKELEPIKKIRAEGETLEALVKKAEPSMFFVRTLDESGQPSVGSAFAVASDADQTFLVLSYNTIRAATHNPGPDVFVRQGGQETKVGVYSWQPEKDLALIVLPRGGVPALEFAPADPPLRIGERLFALSGLGTAGGAITQGFVGDVSENGVQHDAAIGPAFQGGPLLNSDGRVVAVSSRAYAPLGFGTDGVFFGVPIRSTCDKVLRCPGGTPSGAGPRR
jgi:S1-C subfamily serine protease